MPTRGTFVARLMTYPIEKRLKSCFFPINVLRTVVILPKADHPRIIDRGGVNPTRCRARTGVFPDARSPRQRAGDFRRATGLGTGRQPPSKGRDIPHLPGRTEAKPEAVAAARLCGDLARSRGLFTLDRVAHDGLLLDAVGPVSGGDVDG